MIRLENGIVARTHQYVGLMYSKRSRYTRVAIMTLQIEDKVMYNEMVEDVHGDHCVFAWHEHEKKAKHR